MTARSVDDSGMRSGGAWIIALALVVFSLMVAFQDGLLSMVKSWEQAEYSHGYLIPAVTLFLVWRNRHRLAEAGRKGAWLGTLVVMVGLAVSLMGELGTIYTVIQYAFLVTIFGLALAFLGWRGMRFVWIPLLYLAFMIPLPSFLYNGLSSDLQLISSQLGVAVIRLFGISVFLDGNVIDLGIYKLQVVEACSGLRYLFPLMSFGFLCAYLYRGPLWQKAVFFLSTIPITVLMNSFRIGVIGVLVETHGIAAAEGFLHYFEGWFIFMACLLILFGEVWLFTLFSRSESSVFERFHLDALRPEGKASSPSYETLPRPYVASLALVIVAAAATVFLGGRTEAALDRESLVTFPMRIGDWGGRDLGLDREIVEALKLDDYVLADFERASDTAGVNFYVAYYGSQRKGQSVHSPQSCIPGGGWRIESFDQRSLADVETNGQPLHVNRAIIAKGDLKQLVYYWFPQRDRILTSEYWVKWYIFWDALLRNRTDGALVRLVTPVVGVDGMEQADKRLSSFARVAFPKLKPYFPS